MTILKLIPVILVLLVVVFFAYLSFSSRQIELKTGAEKDLPSCPGKPNCVNSNASNPKHKINSFPLLQNNPEKSWQKLIQKIQQAGGEIQVNNGHYCHAVFTSFLFRFKDDLEIKLKESEIAVRSASRVGTSDLGQNRKRVEKIRMMYQELKEP